jgi:glycosyltransferase involved in cell wall biosynthesis
MSEQQDLTPLISVIIPTYNRREEVARAISSVLAQDMPSFELIVVDDGSTDGTADGLETISDARLRVIVQPNAGVCAARNTGVAASSGRFVTWLDSDDEARPGWLQFFADAHAYGASLASCAVEFVWSETKRRVVLPEAHDEAFGSMRACFLAGALGVDRGLLDVVGGFREGLTFSEHTDLALRLGGEMIAHPFTTRHTAKRLVTMHRDDRPYDPQVRFDSATTLLEEDEIHLRRSRRLHATYLAIAGVAAGKLGRRREARRLLARSIRANPLAAKNYLRLAQQLVRRD